MKTFKTDGDFKTNYKFLIGGVLPRPIAVVSTLNKDGTNNLAPFSFFTVVSAKPMIIAFCPIIRSSTGLPKDTVVNVEREKEFVVNIVSESFAEQVNECGTELPYGEDEYKYSGLTPIDSEVVKAKRLKESKIHYECKLRDVLSYGEDLGAGRIITGEVVRVHISEDVLEENNRINTDTLAPVGRGAGNDWVKTSDRFQLERKMEAQIQK